MQKANWHFFRSLERAWLKVHQAEYAGAWVALAGATLVACGSSAREVLDASYQRDTSNVLLCIYYCEYNQPASVAIWPVVTVRLRTALF